MPKFNDFDLDIQNTDAIIKAGAYATTDCDSAAGCLDTYACEGSYRRVCFLTVYNNCDY